MAYYDYYRRRNPLWGRPEYVLDSPPAPGYQPQPQWRGFDYYRAHFDGSPDPSMFDSVWSRIRSHGRPSVSRQEAAQWHRRVYGGLADLTSMMPSEIGSAAGYEAWRFWEHHHGIYRGPLMDDHERESEALVGLAIGEAEKLWGYTRRHGDKYGKREALETAAAVAMKLYRKGGSYPSSRVQYEEPYIMPDTRYSRHHEREREYRHRRSSSVSPLEYEDDYRRDGYSSSVGDLSDYHRSPNLVSGYPLSPGGVPGSLPLGYERRRASSFYAGTPLVPTGTSPYIPPLEASVPISPHAGAVILPPSSGGLFGSYGTTHEYRDPSGRIVHHTRHGDPTSEYSHLPPGTYMVPGGSHRRKHRKSHSGVRYVM